jgi:hypothetical protein
MDGTMAHYIQFDSGNEDGEVILVEVDGDEIDDEDEGTTKVGIKSFLEGTIALAQKPFSTAIRCAVKHNVEGLIEAVRALPDPPSEVEIAFGLKATGEIGNIAVGKTGAETNYNVKLIWKSKG